MISNKHYDEVAHKFIKEETRESLITHNLKLTLTQSINAVNPRQHRKATWVGVDIITPNGLSSNHEKHATFNNMFDVTVSTMDGTNSETIHNCYPVGGIINDVVSNAIKVITNTINHKENSMVLVLNIDDVSLDEGVDPIGYVFDYLDSFFGPRMTVGSTDFNKETGEAKIVFLPSELPSFQQAVDHLEHYFIDCMELYINNQEEATELEPWLLVKMLSGVIKFEDWSTVIQNAFLCALFNSIADVTFKSVAWQNTDTPA